MSADGELLRVLYNGISANHHPRGVENYHMGLLEALNDVGDPPHVVLLSAPWQDYYERLEGLTNVERLVMRLPRGRMPRGLWQTLSRAHAKIPYDVVHLGNVLPVPAGLRRPLTATIHDALEFTPSSPYGFVRRGVRRTLIRRIVRAARTVVTVSELSRQALIAALGVDASRIEVVGTGVDQRDLPDPLPAASRDRAVVFIGAVERHKRLELLLTALAKDPSLRLRVIGAGGGHASRVKREAYRAGVAGQVEWLGRLSEDEKTHVIRRSAMVVMPSDHEGFGLPILESLREGTPVAVSSNLPFAASWAAVGGPVFAAGDSVELAARLDLCINDVHERDRLVDAGRALLTSYSWRSVAKCVNVVWRRAAKSDEPLPGAF